jgi:hypothetical protein
MKIIITESQYNRILLEQPESVMDKRLGIQDRNMKSLGLNPSNTSDIKKYSEDVYGKSFTGHQVAAMLQIGTAFIPIIGPFISSGIGFLEAKAYWDEGDKNSAVLTAIFFSLPAIGSVVLKIPGVKQLGKKGMSALASNIVKLGEKYKPTKVEQEVIQGIEQNTDLIQKEMKNVANKFKTDVESGKAIKIPAGGSKNVGIYSYGDYIIKRVKPNRKISQETIDLLSQRVSNMERVITPKSLVNLSDGTQGILMNKASGVGAENLTDDMINKIPQQHWDNLLKDIKELSNKGIQTDLTKRSNFFYDPKKGFQLLDIEAASLEGDATLKFFQKNGDTYYYPFEKYPFFPKKFTSSKDMFLLIPKH